MEQYVNQGFWVHCEYQCAGKRNRIKEAFITQTCHVSAYARCSDLERTGFSDDDRPRIYNAVGFETFDGAFGFLTEQVDQSQKEYKSTRFFYYPDPELNPTLIKIQESTNMKA